MYDPSSLKRSIHGDKYSTQKAIEHELHRRARDESGFHSKFTFEQVTHIAVLAYEGIVPDGTYSDDECALWESLRREFHHYS